MRYKDIKNIPLQQRQIPTIEDSPEDMGDDPIVQSLRNKITTYYSNERAIPTMAFSTES